MPDTLRRRRREGASTVLSGPMSELMRSWTSIVMSVVRGRVHIVREGTVWKNPHGVCLLETMKKTTSKKKMTKILLKREHAGRFLGLQAPSLPQFMIANFACVAFIFRHLSLVSRVDRAFPRFPTKFKIQNFELIMPRDVCADLENDEFEDE